MNITSFPDALNLKINRPIQLFEYQKDASTWRNKISLTCHTISFLREGSKGLIADNKSLTINNNEFLIMKPGNCLMTENISTGNKTYKSMLLFFTEETLLDFIKQQEFDYSPSGDSKFYSVFKYDDYIEHFVQSLKNISKLNEVLQTKLLQVKFEEIMIYLIEKEGPSFLNNILGTYDDTILRLTNVVENNKLNKLGLQELAFLCSMSLSTFKRAFKNHYELSPIKWFQEQRLEHAAFLLSMQKKRPIELYEEAGYESLSNFIQAFKQKYGTTPKQFQGS
jgi:AraC-like DNA-binding protein